MAEIHIERRTDDRVLWPWILAVLLLAVIAWYVLGQRTSDADVVDSLATPVAADEPGDIRPASGAVGAYLQFVDEQRARQATGIDAGYTAHGLRRLADALESVAGEAATGGEVRALLGRVRLIADSLARAPLVSEPAARAREAFLSAADLMAVLHAERFPNAGGLVAEVREAATLVRPQRALLEQSRAVGTFFERAADALRSMAPQAV